MKKGSALYNTASDLFGNTYGQQTVDTLPKVPLNTWNTLSDVADTNFSHPTATSKPQIHIPAIPGLSRGWQEVSRGLSRPARAMAPK